MARDGTVAGASALPVRGVIADRAAPRTGSDQAVCPSATAPARDGDPSGKHGDVGGRRVGAPVPLGGDARLGEEPPAPPADPDEPARPPRPSPRKAAAPSPRRRPTAAGVREPVIDRLSADDRVSGRTRSWTGTIRAVRWSGWSGWSLSPAPPPPGLAGGSGRHRTGLVRPAQELARQLAADGLADRHIGGRPGRVPRGVGAGRLRPPPQGRLNRGGGPAGRRPAGAPRDDAPGRPRPRHVTSRTEQSRAEPSRAEVQG